MSENNHIVEFHMYCPKCRYYAIAEGNSPCRECLLKPARSYSRKPINFVDKGDKK